MRNHQLILLHFALITFCCSLLKQKKWRNLTDFCWEREKKQAYRCYNCEFSKVYFPNSMSIDYLQYSIYFSFIPSGGAFNHMVLKESTLTSITMLINRTFPFCRRPQRATLSVSVAESPHSLGPIHVFPMLQFTHWIRLGPKKVFQSQLSSGKEQRRSNRGGGEILKPFH